MKDFCKAMSIPAICVVFALAMFGIESLVAQDPTPTPQAASLRIKTPQGWVDLSAPAGSAFVVDGASIQVEGVANEPMALERTIDGFSLTCNGWTYTTAGAFTMSKDGKALVVSTNGAAASLPPADDPGFDKIQDVGETPAAPKAAPKKP